MGTPPLSGTAEIANMKIVRTMNNYADGHLQFSVSSRNNVALIMWLQHNQTTCEYLERAVTLTPQALRPNVQLKWSLSALQESTSNALIQGFP